MNQCEKETDGAICGQDASGGVTDSAGHTHWYCAKHLWEPSPANGEGTCDILGANPPSLERCGRPAVMKITNPAGHVVHYCESCRRKHRPSESEKAADTKRDERSEKINDALQPIFGVIGTAFLIACVGGGIYVLVAFIKWCWIHS
jgi:hypothetical protein